MAFLELQNIEKRFASFTAVQDFNLSVDRGEFVTFLGPSGCGKTTVLRMLAGFEQPTRGTIAINGRDMTSTPVNKRNIGMVFQSYALFPNMTVAGNIGFGLKVDGESSSTIKDRVNEMLRLINMTEFAGRYPHQLSGGQQQRVALARAVAIRPELLLLDEPLSALDAKIRVSLRQEIRQIQRQLKITAIFVTHDQEEALSISDRIVVMSKGHIEQVGTPLQIYNTPETHFVASFVGTLNLLTAQVVDQNQGLIMLDGQHLQVVDPLDRVQSNQSVAIAIRPEAISLNNGTAANASKLTGTVDDIYFLGSVVRIRIRLSDQFINADTFNNPNLVLPERGKRIELSFPRDTCKVLREDAGVERLRPDVI